MVLPLSILPIAPSYCAGSSHYRWHLIFLQIKSSAVDERYEKKERISGFQYLVDALDSGLQFPRSRELEVENNSLFKNGSPDEDMILYSGSSSVGWPNYFLVTKSLSSKLVGCIEDAKCRGGCHSHQVIHYCSERGPL